MTYLEIQEKQILHTLIISNRKKKENEAHSVQKLKNREKNHD